MESPRTRGHLLCSIPCLLGSLTTGRTPLPTFARVGHSLLPQPSPASWLHQPGCFCPTATRTPTCLGRGPAQVVRVLDSRPAQRSGSPGQCPTRGQLGAHGRCPWSPAWEAPAWIIGWLPPATGNFPKSAGSWCPTPSSWCLGLAPVQFGGPLEAAMDGGCRPLGVREMDVPPPPNPATLFWAPSRGWGRTVLPAGPRSALGPAAALFCPPKKPRLATPGHGIVCR